MEWKFLRFLQKWDTLVVKDGKSCESGEIGHSRVNLSLILGKKMEKPAKWPKLAILSQSKPLFWQNLPLSVILSLFAEKQFEKVEKLKNLLMYPPRTKTFEISQKWDALVAKDGESCESGEIGHSKSIWASSWGKRWKNLQNAQNWPFWANLSHFDWQKLPLWVILSHFHWEMIWKSWKTQKNCQCISIKILLRYLEFSSLLKL